MIASNALHLSAARLNGMLSRKSPPLLPLLLALAVSPCARVMAQVDVPERPQRAAEPGTQDRLTGRLEQRAGRKVLTLWGSPKERGYAHGYLLAEQIVRAMNEDLAGFLKRVGHDAKSYESRVLRVLVPPFHWSYEEITELRGMLEGIRARLTPAERRLGFLKREIRLVDLKAINTAGDWLKLGCSTIAIAGERTADGKPVVARNFDFHGFRALLDDQLVVRSRASKKRKAWIGVTHPGGIGVITAMNQAGVFVSIHDVYVRPAGIADLIRRNLPRLVALRRLMETLDAEGAVRRAHEKLCEWSTLFGNNVMIVTPHVDAENVFAGVIEYDVREKLDRGATLRTSDHLDAQAQPWLTCTNHHRVRASDGELHACSRYDRLCGWVRARTNAVLPDPLGTKSLFELANQAAIGRGNDVQELLDVGTLHQAVAFTGSRTIHFKLGRLGSKIADVRALEFKLAALVSESERPVNR